MKLSPWDPDIRSIVSRIDADDVDLQPDFQRQEVWPIPKKKRLIDTVLREWSIPPIHFVVTQENKLVVLDGQQRLAAIRDFVHDGFSIDAKISPVDPLLSHLHGLFYSQLDAATKRKIDNYPLRAFRITEYQPEEPNELFYRLNQPTMLTAGEQRNALFGPAREQLKQLVQSFEDAGNVKETIGFSNARMAYDDIFAKLLFFLEKKNFAIRASEGLISERFKTKEPFQSEIFNKASRSVLFFSTSRTSSSPRFNKASVLSWLLFFSRFSEAPNEHFLGEFMSAKFSRPNSRFVSDIYSLFENRSSLRVADVSSVVFRDFCLWYAFVNANNHPVPNNIPVATIQSISSQHRQDIHDTLEALLLKELDVSAWGMTL